MKFLGGRGNETSFSTLVQLINDVFRAFMFEWQTPDGTSRTASTARGFIGPDPAVQVKGRCVVFLCHTGSVKVPPCTKGCYSVPGRNFLGDLSPWHCVKRDKITLRHRQADFCRQGFWNENNVLLLAFWAHLVCWWPKIWCQKGKYPS